VTLSQVLDQVDAYLGRFVSFPCPEARHAVTLWAAHTHAFDCFDSTPRLALTSPEKQSGKTRCLEVLGLLVAHPLHTTSVTSAVLYRMIDRGPTPTVLLDEYDTIFGQHASDRSEEVRALINAGHRRGVTIPRCVPPSMDPREFATFAPVALAGIGQLPDTVSDRAVVVAMRRQTQGDRAQPFRVRKHEPEGIELGDSLADCMDAIRHTLDGYEPDNPLEDRPADVWEPPLAIAEHAGPDWARRARTAATALTGGQGSSETLGVELLRDIRAVWPAMEPTVPVTALVELLCQDNELRWAEHRGKGLTARSLAQMLRPFGIHSHKEAAANVYARSDLLDPWGRYLEPPSSSPEGPQGPEGPELEELEEMDLLRKERATPIEALF